MGAIHVGVLVSLHLGRYTGSYHSNSLRRRSTLHQILFLGNPTSMMTNLYSSLIPARTNHYHRTRNCSQLRAKMSMATATRTKWNDMATGIFSWETSTPAAAGQISRRRGKTIFEMEELRLPEGVWRRRRASSWSVDLLPLVLGHSSSCIFATTRAYKTSLSSPRNSSSPG
jgi:hypothetical protein